jgi:hypothetical protein
MKQLIMATILLMGVTFSYAGNGNEGPNCNCGSPNEVNLFASGTAVRVGIRQIRCVGTEGTCWEVNITPDGWSLTVFTQPPLVFTNSTGNGDNTLTAPSEVSRTEASKTYQWGNEWKQVK